MFFIETLVIAPCCGEETVHVKIALLHWEGWEGGGAIRWLPPRVRFWGRGIRILYVGERIMLQLNFFSQVFFIPMSVSFNVS